MNNERMTNPEITKALGMFDLDPCCSKQQNYYHANNNLFVESNNGLVSNWNGRVWLNPPYSLPKPWLDRMAQHNNGSQSRCPGSTDRVRSAPPDSGCGPVANKPPSSRAWADCLYPWRQTPRDYR